MNVDLTLDAMRFPNLPNFTPDFGTKESGENEGVGTEDMCGNFMLPFSKQRPVSVTETSTTTAVESDCAISVEASGTTLTMGRPSFVGVSAKVYGKFQSGTASVVYNDAAATTKTYTLHPGECLELCALVSGQSGYWGENMARSSSSILLVAAGAFDAAKTVSLPAGYATPYQAIKVVFPTGHAVSSDTAMTLNGIAVVSNQNGTLAPLPRHQITTGIYSVLMANVCLEMYYSSDYDGNGTPAWVVVGNPVVLSSSTYTIYADGKVGEGEVCEIKSGLWSTAPYGWLLCQGQPLKRADYPNLVAFITDNNLIGSGKPFGAGDGSTTFVNIDLRGEFLRGAGTNGHSGQGNGGTVGAHQDGSAFVDLYRDSGSGIIYSPFCKNHDSYNTFASEYTAFAGISSTSVNRAYFGTRPTNTSVNYIIKAM